MSGNVGSRPRYLAEIASLVRDGLRIGHTRREPGAQQIGELVLRRADRIDLRHLVVAFHHMEDVVPARFGEHAMDHFALRDLRSRGIPFSASENSGMLVFLSCASPIF